MGRKSNSSDMTTEVAIRVKFRALSSRLDEHTRRIWAATEASGGVSLKALPGLAKLGLDFISCGALVHQSRWVDIGLDWSTK